MPVPVSGSGGGRRGIMARRPGARRMDLTLGIVEAAFLTVAVISPMRLDYFFYLEIWYRIRHGQDPWFTVLGQNGLAPLNAYGPLFNPMAGLAWINPVAPRLLFSYAYILFAISTTRGFAAGRPLTGLRVLGSLALFWNPFAWVEVAFYGHFDILVGLACLGAVRAWAGGRDIRSGMCLAAGVLLKYLPIVLLPFLALDRDRGRLRIRFLAVTLATIAVGLAESWLYWGPSTFLHLQLAATRKATALSIFRFLHGRYSPLPWLGIPGNCERLSNACPATGPGGVWWSFRARKPDVETTAASPRRSPQAGPGAFERLQNGRPSQVRLHFQTGFGGILVRVVEEVTWVVLRLNQHQPVEVLGVILLLPTP